MIKLPLKKSKIYPYNSKHRIPWVSCAPFVENRVGILVHRPKRVTTHTFFKKPHISIEYMCGNVASGHDKFTFLAFPSEDSIVCEICERNAVNTYLPSSESLAGRHVHIGRLKAVATCGCAVPDQTGYE